MSDTCTRSTTESPRSESGHPGGSVDDTRSTIDLVPVGLRVRGKAVLVVGAGRIAAEARRIWCNAADDPEHCSVVLPATVHRGDVSVAVSTGGRSPASASWLRRRIDSMLDEDTLDVVGVATRIRDRMRASGQSTEVAGWVEVLDEHALHMVTTGRLAELEARLAAAVGAAPEVEEARP